MKDLNIGVADGEIDNIIREIDYVGNGKINYTEFLSATLSIQDTLTEEMLWSLFKKFDTDDTGFISKENLMDAFKRLGRKEITMFDVSGMINTHDIAKDGKISFIEFKKIFNIEDKVDGVDLRKIVNAEQNDADLGHVLVQEAQEGAIEFNEFAEAQ